MTKRMIKSKIGGHDYDEAYVREILAAMPKGLSLTEFGLRTQKDRNAGYTAEVVEAAHRYILADQIPFDPPYKVKKSD